MNGKRGTTRKAKASSPWKGPDRIKADLSKQMPNNSYSPKLQYESVEFTCRDCGVECVWTAEQQRLYYEEWGGNIYATAIRCRECRTSSRHAKIEQSRASASSPPKPEKKQKVRKASSTKPPTS